MTPSAPLMTGCLREHLPVPQGYSPHTGDTCAHAFRRLFTFARARPGRRPSHLGLEPLAATLRAWLAVRGPVPAPELFVNAGGTAMTRAGFEYVLAKHARAAAATCPGLQGRSVAPHQLRHSCAVIMLQATRDIRKVALRLGHADVRTTEGYWRVDPTEKLEAVEAILPPALRRGGCKAPDALIAWLLDRE